MTKITGRDLQVFVGGALAILGFSEFYWLPYYILEHRDAIVIIASLMAGLTLPLGMAILFNRKQSIVLTKIYLWLTISCAVIGLPFFEFSNHFKSTAVHWKTVLDLTTSVILLLLLHWSRSKRFQASEEKSQPEAGV